MNTFHCVNLAGHLCGHQHEALEEALDCAQELLDQAGDFRVSDVSRVPIVVDLNCKVAWDDLVSQFRQIPPDAKARWEALLANGRYTNEEFIALVG